MAMCAQSNHAKHAVVIYGLPHDMYTAADLQRAHGKASLCSRIVVKVQRQPDAFKHTVLHMHSVHCSPAVASAVWPSDGQQCINTHKPLSCIVQQLV